MLRGMTAAVLGSLALNKSLKAQRDQHRAGDLTGLAGTFQKQLSQAMADLWQMATDQDRRWPMVEVVEEVRPSSTPTPATCSQDRAGSVEEA